MSKSETDYAIELAEIALKILHDRGETYQGNQGKTSKILSILFPDGVESKDYERYKLISHIVEKLSRYVLNFNKGGHFDSAIDVSNYSLLLAATDMRNKEQSK